MNEFMSESEDAEMTAYASRGMTIYPPPQPVEQLIEDRLKNLLAWWKHQTGINIFTDDANFRLGWRILCDPRSPDKFSLEVLRKALVCDLTDQTLDELVWMSSHSDALKERRDLHDNLVKAARAVLTRPGMSYEDSAPKISDDLARYDEQRRCEGAGAFQIPDDPGPSPDIATWDRLVPPEVCQAALLLAKHPNPYPKDERPGDNYHGRIGPKIWRQFISPLCLLQRGNGQPLRPRELALLALFLRPEYFNQFPEACSEDTPPSYLSGKAVDQGKSWWWGLENTSENEADFFKCDGFRRLTDKIGKCVRAEQKK